MFVSSCPRADEDECGEIGHSCVEQLFQCPSLALSCGPGNEFFRVSELAIEKGIQSSVEIATAAREASFVLDAQKAVNLNKHLVGDAVNRGHLVVDESSRRLGYNRRG